MPNIDQYCCVSFIPHSNFICTLIFFSFNETLHIWWNWKKKIVADFIVWKSVWRLSWNTFSIFIYLFSLINSIYWSIKWPSINWNKFDISHIDTQTHTETSLRRDEIESTVCLMPKRMAIYRPTKLNRLTNLYTIQKKKVTNKEN